MPFAPPHGHVQADAQLLSMIMLLQDILLDDLAQSSHSNGHSNGTTSLNPHQRNDFVVKPPTHVVGVVRCPPSVEVSPAPRWTLSSAVCCYSQSILPGQLSKGQGCCKRLLLRGIMRIVTRW